MSEEKNNMKEIPVEKTVTNTQAAAAKSLIHETLHYDESIADEYGTARAEKAEARAVEIAAPVSQGQETTAEQKEIPVQEAAPVQNTVPVMPEMAEKTEHTTYEKETAEDRAAENEYTEAVKDPKDRSEKIKQIKNLFTHSTRRRFSREEVILSRISDDQLMEYLTLEQRRLESLQKARESRNEKLLVVFQLAAVLLAIVGVVALLKDNPVVLVNILYIIGIVIAIWIWKNPGKPGKH